MLSGRFATLVTYATTESMGCSEGKSLYMGAESKYFRSKRVSTTKLGANVAHSDACTLMKDTFPYNHNVLALSPVITNVVSVTA